MKQKATEGTRTVVLVGKERDFEGFLKIPALVHFRSRHRLITLSVRAKII